MSKQSYGASRPAIRTVVHGNGFKMSVLLLLMEKYSIKLKLK